MMNPIVSVTLPGGDRVTAVLLGRLTRVGGVSVAAEVQIDRIEHGMSREVELAQGQVIGFSYRPFPTQRITLVPIEHVQAMNDEARALMADVGPKPGKAAA